MADDVSGQRTTKCLMAPSIGITRFSFYLIFKLKGLKQFVKTIQQTETHFSLVSEKALHTSTQSAEFQVP